MIQTFQLELPVKSLFGVPTVAEMAAVIEQPMFNRASDETLSRMLSEIEAMTEEEAEKLLGAKNLGGKT